MYPLQNEPSRPEPSWYARPSQPEIDAEAPERRPAIPPPPTYVPPPVPPAQAPGSGTLVGTMRPPQQWLRIPIERPIVTPIILGILVAVFLLTLLIGGSIDASEDTDLLVRLGAKVNSLVVVDGEWWRLVTVTFLHGGFLHIALNGYALYAIGMDLESFMGRARFLAVYVISGLGGSVASLIFSPYNAVGVGASGAIFGLIGALAVYFGINRSLFGKLGQMQFWNIIIVIAINLVIGFSGFFPIDNSAHLGGLIAGAAAGYVLCPRYRLGGWMNPLVREAENTNKDVLSWLAAGLILLNIIAIFFVALLLYNAGFLPME
jgi:rhomboid protease GluP